MPLAAGITCAVSTQTPAGFATHLPWSMWAVQGSCYSPDRRDAVLRLGLELNFTVTFIICWAFREGQSIGQGHHHGKCWPSIHFSKLPFPETACVCRKVLWPEGHSSKISKAGFFHVFFRVILQTTPSSFCQVGCGWWYLSEGEKPVLRFTSRNFAASTKILGNARTTQDWEQRVKCKHFSLRELSHPPVFGFMLLWAAERVSCPTSFGTWKPSQGTWEEGTYCIHYVGPGETGWSH